VNQKLTKRTLIKEYTEEIEKLKKDLLAAREKNGIYIAEENFLAMQQEIKSQQELNAEREAKISVLQEEMRKLSELFTDTQQELEERCMELEEKDTELRKTNCSLKETKHTLRTTILERDQNQYLVDEHSKTENYLHSQASTLLHVVEDSISDVDGLHLKLDRKHNVEAHNVNARDTFGEDCRHLIKTAKQNLNQFQGENFVFFDAMRKTLGTLVSKKAEESVELQDQMQSFKNSMVAQIQEMSSREQEKDDACDAWRSDVSGMVEGNKDNICSVLHTLMNQEFLPKMRALESSFHSMAVFQEQFEAFFTDKMSQLSSMVKTFVEGQDSMLESLDEMIERHSQEQAQGYGEIIRKTDSLLNNQKILMKELQQTFFKQMMSLFQEVNDKQTEKLSDDASKVTEVTSIARQNAETANTNLRSYCDSLKNCASQFSDNCSQTVVNNTAEAQKSFKQAAEQIHDTTNLRKGVEEDVMNASHKVDELAVQWQNMLEESFSQHLVTLKSCSAQQQSSVKVCEEQLEQHFTGVKTALASQDHSLGEMAATQERHLSDQSESTNTWSRDQDKLVEQVNTRVNQFLLGDLKDDLPTGSTPQRRPFAYPTALIRTEPLDVLRQRFQASYVAPPFSPEPQPIKSVSSDESVPVFELSQSSTVSSETGVYPLRSSEGDLLDNDSLEDSENEVVVATDEAVFVEPQAVVARNKAMSANTTTDKENKEATLNRASSIPNLAGVGSKIPSVNKFKTPVDRVKRPLRSMNTQ